MTTDEYNINFSLVPLFSFTHRPACSCGLLAAILLLSCSLRFSCMSSTSNDYTEKTTMIFVKNRIKLFGSKLIYVHLNLTPTICNFAVYKCGGCITTLVEIIARSLKICKDLQRLCKDPLRQGSFKAF